MSPQNLLVASSLTILLWVALLLLYIGRVIFKEAEAQLFFVLGSFLLFPLISFGLLLSKGPLKSNFYNDFAVIMVLEILIFLIPFAIIARIIDKRRQKGKMKGLFFGTVKKLSSSIKGQKVTVVSGKKEKRTFFLKDTEIKLSKRYLFAFHSETDIILAEKLKGEIHFLNGKTFFSAFLIKGEPLRIFIPKEIKDSLDKNDALKCSLFCDSERDIFVLTIYEDTGEEMSFSVDI